MEQVPKSISGGLQAWMLWLNYVHEFCVDNLQHSRQVTIAFRENHDWACGRRSLTCQGVSSTSAKLKLGEAAECCVFEISLPTYCSAASAVLASLNAG